MKNEKLIICNAQGCKNYFCGRNLIVGADLFWEMKSITMSIIGKEDDKMLEAAARIKLLKNPDVTELAGEKVMVDFDSGKYFMLSGSANDIWGLISDGIAFEDIVEKLLEMYQVEEPMCRKSTSKFLGKLQDAGFISIEGNV